MNESILSRACPDLEAFCQLGLTQEEVSALLTKLGFRLVFQLEEQCDHSLLLPPLPAQYHYADDAGTAVIYLAGRDYPLHEDGSYGFPPHQSRFWLSCGASPEAYQTSRVVLALSWGFAWRDAGNGDDTSDDDDLMTLTQEVA
jgi:hypothetical protein